jgi:high affinity sulfate transporter 1
MPILSWLPRYRRSWLRLDVVAGISAWGLTVPTSMGYAQLAGLPLSAGLYSALVALLAYSLLGTSRRLKVQTSSAMAALSAAIVLPLARGDVSRTVALSAALALLVGLMLVFASMARMGFIADFLAKPVVAGFLFGLALFIIVGRLPILFGLPQGSGTVVQQLWQFVTSLGGTNPWTLAISVAALVLIYLFQRYLPAFPGALVMMVLGIVTVLIFDLDQNDVALVGHFPPGLPSFKIPWVYLSDLVFLSVGAAAVVFVALGESVGIARTFATRHQTRVDPDQELLALGVANIGAGLFQGFSVGANAAATASADRARTKTQVASLVTVGILLITLVTVAQPLAYLPIAVLAVAVIMSVVRLLGISELGRYFRTSRTDFALAMTALSGVVLAGMLAGLFLAVSLSLALVLYRSSRPHITVRGRMSGRAAFADIERNPGVEQIPGLLIVRPAVPLFFANAEAARSQILALVARSRSPLNAVLIDMSASADLDVASTDMLGSLVEDLAERSLDLWLAAPQEVTRDRIRQRGLLQRMGDDHLYLSVSDAVDYWSGSANEGLAAVAASPSSE